MHRCLNIDEIVRLIACELVMSGRKATAVCLACCCKGFQDPVLDTLWATQFDLLALFKCFPEDVWNEGGYTSFKRLPTAAEWARFRKYARRIRELKDQGAPITLSWEVYSVAQLHVANEPFLPNLTTLDLCEIKEPLTPFIPLLLSPTITSTSLGSPDNHIPTSVAASLITNVLTSCPDVQDVSFPFLPRDPVITSAASKLFFATHGKALRRFYVDSPLTEEATEAIYKSQNLSDLLAHIEEGTPIPSASLPNLTRLEIHCKYWSNGLQFLRRATFGKLKSIEINIEHCSTDDNILKAFQEIVFHSSIQDTLSAICITIDSSLNLDYYSLLPFTRLVHLDIRPYCDDGCSWVNDDIVIDLSRAMPKLESLTLGNWPCSEFTGGVTAKGLVALARNCRNLSSLCVHFQVASLSSPPTGLETTHTAEYSALWTGCALTRLDVGEMAVSDDSAPMVALTLLCIFPRIETIVFLLEAWDVVDAMIRRLRQIVNCSSVGLMAGN